MEGEPQNPSLKDRLKLGRFDYKACLAAMKGEAIPHELGNPMHEICVIRGIRYNNGYGEALRGLDPRFTRALNARCIMSNKIPIMSAPDEIPYCIWHPTTASEETYRQLVGSYPEMAYHVGRACAVAGYARLYQELDILPDVHIAEEARECGNHDIYELIVSQNVRYSIMNDYTRTIHPGNLKPAVLNGDTAVCWMLDIKEELEKYACHYITEDDGLYPESFFDDAYNALDRTFNITEDSRIDENASGGEQRRLQADRLEVQLLTEPLPVDLPTVQKDLLIGMAAYKGDIDRYVRLRRPTPVYGENNCLIRGIYHNTLFAVWYSKAVPGENEAAINARMIMNNVLSGAPYKYAPYLIWWPTIALQSTYRQLAKIQPEMSLQVVHACIVAGYRDLFDELLPYITPNSVLVRQAELQADLHFREALAECRVIDISEVPGLNWTEGILSLQHLESNGGDIPYWLGNTSFKVCWFRPYDTRSCDASRIELFACLPEEWRIPSDRIEDFYNHLDYIECPPHASTTAVEETET